ncbi:MAG: PhoU domain-containing protein [Promethearchaeota archaeon]
MIDFRRIRKTGGSTYIVTLPKKWVNFHKIKPNQNLGCIVQADGNLLINPFQSPELRKVQKTGGSSIIISLPKEWINAQNLKEKQEIALISQENGMMLLSSHIHLEKEKLIKQIQVSEKTQPDFLLRILIASYVMGFSEIIVNSELEMSSQNRDVIIEFTRMIIGMEIVGETMHTINLQETIDINDKLFEKGIKRMEILVKSMQKDVITAIESNNRNLLGKVISRDEEVNKLHRLVRRQMNRILRNANIPHYSKISSFTLKQNFLLSQNVERIGDQTVNIAKIMQNHFDSTQSLDYISTIKKMSEITLSALDQSILAWRTENTTLANKCINEIQDIHEIFIKDLNDGAQKNGSLSLHLIREQFKNSILLVQNIAEIVIDLMIL